MGVVDKAAWMVDVQVHVTKDTHELLDGDVSLIKYLNQLMKVEVGRNSYLMEGKANLLLNENYFLYNTLCYVPTSLCFKDMTTDYYLEVVDKAALKVDVHVHVTKDKYEILNVDVSNVQAPKIITIFNFLSKKFIAKITPSMMTMELLDGEVSLIKYLNQLTKLEVGANSYLMEGKTNLRLK